MVAFGSDSASIEVKAEKVTDNLYVLFGLGGNIGVSLGHDGLLVIDDQFPMLMPKINKAQAKLGSQEAKDVDFVINTQGG
mgnify:CR=1 FL=1